MRPRWRPRCGWTAEPDERATQRRRAGWLVRPRLVIAALPTLVCLAVLVGAQAAAQPPGLEPPERRTAPVVVDTVAPADLPEDPTSFTTVIEMDEFAGESKSIESILGDTVGVQVRRFGGPGDPSEISIRGSSANQVVILLDGVRLNTAQTGGVDLSTIPRELIERIEISRGGGSIQAGSDAIGGVVNLISRRPGGVPRTTAVFAAESFDTWRGSAATSGSWRDTEYSLGYSGFATEGDWEFRAAAREVDGVRLPTRSGSFERVNNESELHSVVAGVARDLGEWGRVELRDSFLYDSAGRPGPDAGGGSRLGQSLTAHQRRVRNLGDLRLEVVGGEDASLRGEVRAFHRYDRSRFRDPAGRPPFDGDNRNHAVGGRLRGVADVALGPTAHELSLGTELRWDKLVAKDAPNRDRRVVGVFLQDEIAVWERRIRVVPALRFDDTQGFDSEWIPRVGVVFAPFTWLEIKGNYERSYRVPNFDELYFDDEFVRGNPNLDPEDAWNADVGFEVGFDRIGPVTQAWLEFAVFRNDIDESIVFQPISVQVVGATNTGKALIEGLELGGGFRLFGWIEFSGNLTLLDAELDDSNTPLPGRPDTEYHLRLVIGPPSGLVKLTGERSHRSSIPVTSTGGTRVSSATLYDASLAVDAAQLPWVGDWIPGRRLLLSFTAQNLTDQSVRDAQFFPQPGRILSFRVAWEL